MNVIIGQFICNGCSQLQNSNDESYSFLIQAQLSYPVIYMSMYLCENKIHNSNVTALTELSCAAKHL